MQRNEEDDNVTEDQLSAFNTFQFWRTPLPELDLSLLDPQLSRHAGSRTFPYFKIELSGFPLILYIFCTVHLKI
uniref:Putative WW-binding domain-containing protein n=1 Tax=Astyanax mexicanus TaxID=7994 RepID=A0A8B9HE92_ASTMX